MPGFEVAWLIPILPLVSFILISAFGRHLPLRGAFLGVAAIATSFILFWFVLHRLLFSAPASLQTTWLEIGAYSLQLGIIVDPLSVLMLGLVSFVSLAVQVYSLSYMRGEPRFGWYFAAHSLFAASMLALVLADNLLFLYIGWELVGLCSYLLIGFWYERRAAAEAAKKAFITTRIGDIGLLIAVLLLFKLTGSFNLSTIFQAAQAGDLATSTLTLVSLLIFAGAMGKSAQFPFHVWLPDAMEGPTPVSALIHAATMVAAGVFLVARTYPLFALAPGALPVVVGVGLLTALLAGTMALTMTDLKRILAYSTISQLGLMMLALGAGGYTAALFHLMTHGFFKALLFLGAGSIAHGTDGKTDIREMGGLWRRLPLTTALFLIASLALAGLPPLSGFWSKDEILSSVAHHQPTFVMGLTLVAVLFSALYMARACFIAFFGPLKKENAHAHESPWVMALPMLALGIPSVIAGLVALDWVGPLFRLPSQYAGLDSFLFYGEKGTFHFDLNLVVLSTLLALSGWGLSWGLYLRGWRWPKGLSLRLAPLYRLAANKYYLDDLYQTIINRVVLAFSSFIALFDRVVVNDTGVNGTAHLPVLAGWRLRYHETGKLYNYGLTMILGVIILAILATQLL